MKSFKLKSILTISIILSQSFPIMGHGNKWEANRPDAHAPISVMQDHTHNQQEWMLSYRLMNMDMRGMRQGSHKLSNADVFAKGFMVSPVEMSMNMHMFGFMYAPNNQFTLMAMGHYTEIEMELSAMPGSMAQMNNGSYFKRESKGWGDTTLAALINLGEFANHKIHANAGISLPTGSIDKTDNGHLPYPMQTGSGSYELKPGLTYSGQASKISWGAQIMTKFAIDKNDAAYSKGNSTEGKIWGAFKLSNWISLSSQISYLNQSSMDGNDVRIQSKMSPTMDPANSGGQTYFWSLGANFLIFKGPLEGHRFAIDYSAPLDQDLNGIQMQTADTVTIGWQKSF